MSLHGYGAMSLEGTIWEAIFPHLCELSCKWAAQGQLAFFKNTMGVLVTSLRESLDWQFFLLSVGNTLTHPTPWRVCCLVGYFHALEVLTSPPTAEVCALL